MLSVVRLSVNLGSKLDFGSFRIASFSNKSGGFRAPAIENHLRVTWTDFERGLRGCRAGTVHPLTEDR